MFHAIQQQKIHEYANTYIIGEVVVTKVAKRLLCSQCVANGIASQLFWIRFNCNVKCN